MSDTTINVEKLETDKTKRIILSALFAALTCVGTMIIKVPTPTMGYIHPGDGFVLLSGLLLGPLWGGLAAGFGSALSDLIGGYFVYVPATLLIKALTAITAYYVFVALKKVIKIENDIPGLIIASILGELVMVAGYFLFEIFLLSIANHTSISAGVIASLAGIVPNLIQGAFGVVIATVLHPLLKRLSF